MTLYVALVWHVWHHDAHVCTHATEHKAEQDYRRAYKCIGTLIIALIDISLRIRTAGFNKLNLNGPANAASCKEAGFSVCRRTGEEGARGV
jgi:hypothetical protein